MSDYAQITSFGPKDALITGDPNKVIRGTEFDSEFSAISTAIATKYDSSDIASQAQAAAGSSDLVLITPAKLKYALENMTVTLGASITIDADTLGGVAIADIARLSQVTTFTGISLGVQGAASAQFVLKDSGAATDEKTYVIIADDGVLDIGGVTDAGSGFVSAIRLNRTTTTFDLINLQATSVQVNGQSIRDGAIITSVPSTGQLSSGTYTPTASGLSGFDSVTPGLALYTRIGNIVTVSGVITADPSTTGTVQFDLSLPIASNFAGSNACSGAGQFAMDQGSNARVVRIVGDATTDKASFRFNSAITASETLTYTYQYLVA
jgi:hypothetical protein